jgi:hypothetical protein
MSIYSRPAALISSAELIALESQYDGVLGSILDPLQVAVCQLVSKPPVDNVLEEVLLEAAVLEVCLEGLMTTLFALAGSLVDLSTQANNITLYDSSLPITDSKTLFFAASNPILCLELTQAIVNDHIGATAAQICAPILANAPTLTFTAATPTATATGQTTTPTNTDAYLTLGLSLPAACPVASASPERAPV